MDYVEVLNDAGKGKFDLELPILELQIKFIKAHEFL